MKFGFYSCMTGMPWGGSEELWFRTACILLNRGHEVTVNYRHWPREISQLERLRSLGANLHIRQFPDRIEKRWFGSRIVPLDVELDAKNWLHQERPDYVLATLGYHVDRLHVADACLALSIPYSINVQCASDHNFVNDNWLDRFRIWYRNADQVMVVSGENLEKVETNIGAKLDNWVQIDNPSKVSGDADFAWPQTTTFKLACIGRIHLQSKGQDLVVRALSQPHWAGRDWHVTFFGASQGNLKQLEALIENSGVADHFSIGGYSEAEEIWTQHQALVLASRYEGAALVVVEAMRAGRVVIATDTGRNAELIDDGETGFIAPAPTVALVEAALDRAYAQRDQLDAMGREAKKRIASRYPECPEKDLADRLIANAKSKGKTAKPL